MGLGYSLLSAPTKMTTPETGSPLRVTLPETEFAASSPFLSHPLNPTSREQRGTKKGCGGHAEEGARNRRGEQRRSTWKNDSFRRTARGRRQNPPPVGKPREGRSSSSGGNPRGITSYRPGRCRRPAGRR